jgi:hypothetical protein
VALSLIPLNVSQIIFLPRCFVKVIVPDQKVTAGALNAVVVTVVESLRMLLGADGGCVPAGTPTLK